MSNLGFSPASSVLPKYLSEDGITQECKDLMSSLPSHEGWLGNPIYQYQGFWLPLLNLQGCLRFQTHFQPQDSDVILASSPKSGTTWLKALIFALTNRTQYPNSSQHHPLLQTSPHLLVSSLETTLFFHNEIPDWTKLPSPRLLATHLPYVLLPEPVKASSCKMVYISRNPKDTFVSLWYFTNRLRPKERGDISIEKLFDMFCRGSTPNGPFWDHVLGYWRQSLENPKKFLYVSYEEMKEQPVKQLKKLAEFLDHPFSEEEENNGTINDILKLCSLQNLSNLDVTKTGVTSLGLKFDAYYRKGQVGGWRNYLTGEMENRIDKVTEEKWYGSGLKFQA